MPLDSQVLRTFIEQAYHERVIPLLSDYIGIPNKSPSFDSDWHQHGHMYLAASLLLLWAKGQPLDWRHKGENSRFGFSDNYPQTASITTLTFDSDTLPQASYLRPY